MRLRAIREYTGRVTCSHSPPNTSIGYCVTFADEKGIVVADADFNNTEEADFVVNAVNAAFDKAGSPGMHLSVWREDQYNQGTPPHPSIDSEASDGRRQTPPAPPHNVISETVNPIWIGLDIKPIRCPNCCRLYNSTSITLGSPCHHCIGYTPEYAVTLYGDDCAYCGHVEVTATWNGRNICELCQEKEYPSLNLPDYPNASGIPDEADLDNSLDEITVDPPDCRWCAFCGQLISTSLRLLENPVCATCYDNIRTEIDENEDINSDQP